MRRVRDGPLAAWASVASRCAAACGGGFSPPAPFTEAEVLQEDEADHRQEPVMAQPEPAPALEVIEPELFLELLVRWSPPQPT